MVVADFNYKTWFMEGRGRLGVERNGIRFERGHAHSLQVLVFMLASAVRPEYGEFGWLRQNTTDHGTAGASIPAGIAAPDLTFFSRRVAHRAVSLRSAPT